MKTTNIPTPDEQEVKKYLEKWSGLESYVQQESSLHKLFTKTYPLNVDMDDILIKVCSLNDFYSTNIFSPHTVAKHIQQMKIDESLRKNDLFAVNKVSQVTMSNGRVINFYSFASKYFSHHNPEVYPIYDSYVEKLLLHFRRLDKFHSFRNSDLKDYTKFKEVILAFREFYGLTSFGVKDIDRYLWQIGKESFPRTFKPKTDLRV